MLARVLKDVGSPPVGRSGRTGTVPITIHVDLEIRTQLKMLAAEWQTRVHRLDCTGLNCRVRRLCTLSRQEIYWMFDMFDTHSVPRTLSEAKR